MSKGKMKRLITPTTGIGLSIIFLAIARLVLCVYVLCTDPLSSGFGYLLALLFCISVTRHFLFYFNQPIADNIYNFLLDLLTPCVYGFILYHILSVYQTALLSLSVSVFLPCVIYCFLFAGDSNQRMDNKTFAAGLFCYVLPFLFVLNYSFDFSRPTIEKYFLTNKFLATTGSDAEGYSDNYYFDLIHTDSISTPAYWVEVDQKSCNYYHNNWMHKTIKHKDETFVILAKKTPTSSKHQCYFLLRKINGPVYKRVATEQQYSHFERGDTLNMEKHRGLLGIGWLTYR